MTIVLVEKNNFIFTQNKKILINFSFFILLFISQIGMNTNYLCFNKGKENELRNVVRNVSHVFPVLFG